MQGRKDLRRKLVRKHIGRQGLRQIAIEGRDIAHAPAQYDDIGIDEIADDRQTTGQTIHIALLGCAGRGLVPQPCSDHLLSREAAAMVARQAGPGNP